MEQKQRLDYLVEKFKEDSGEYSDLAVPDSEPEKRRILRSLMNIRMPRHLDAEVQEVQDAFLQEDARILFVTFAMCVLSFTDLSKCFHFVLLL